MAGRIVGALVLGPELKGRTTVGYWVMELHSTKGWRKPFLIGRSHFPFGVELGEFHRRPNPKKRFTADSGRLMRNRVFTGPIPTRVRRHAWERKESELRAAAAIAAE